LRDSGSAVFLEDNGVVVKFVVDDNDDDEILLENKEIQRVNDLLFDNWQI